MNRKLIFIGIALSLIILLLREFGILTLNWYESSAVTYSSPSQLDRAKNAGKIGLVTIYQGNFPDFLEGDAKVIDSFTISDGGYPLDLLVCDDTYVSDTLLWMPFFKKGEQKLYIMYEARIQGRWIVDIQNWIQDVSAIGICSHLDLKNQIYRQAFESFRKELTDQSEPDGYTTRD